MATKEINDGEDRAFEHSELVIALLDTPEVQRTENITNNGLCSKGFPGIRHSRKTHLIGTAKRATQIYGALVRNKSNIPESYLSILQALAITHDVGHPPFAHALRNVIEKITGESHEDVSARIIKGDLSFVEYFSDRPHLLGNPDYVGQSLERYKSLPKIPEILESFGVNTDIIVQALSPKVAERTLSSQNLFVKNLIDGSLFDIDKMEYLPRDSKAANIAEGYVDPSRLLNGLKVVDFKGERRIALVDTSLDDLCRWVAARKYMYQNVYTHKTVLKYEAMLTEAVKRSLPYFEENNIEIHLLTDGKVLELLTQFDEVSAQLALDIQFGRPFKYSEAYVIRSRKVIEEDIDEYSNLMAINKYVEGLESDFPEDRIRDEIISIASKQKGQKIEPYDVLVYFPYSFRTKEDWKEKLDLFVYSHSDPSIVCSIADMAEGKAELKDVKAQDVFYELCKPQTSVYFAVYSVNKHKERINNATEEFIYGIK